MTKRKSTKSALITSVLALFLCFAMLLGSTFAWFTDSAASANNIIKSGNLDKKLSFKEYGAENTEWTEVKEDTVVFGKDALYEPGYTEAVWLKVENLGSLAFRYNLAINVLNEKEGVNRDGKSFKLSDYLEVKYMVTTSTEMEENYYTTSDRLHGFNFGGVANSGVASLKEDIAMINNGVAFSKDDAAMSDYSSSYVLVIISMPETVGNEACHNGETIPEITFSLTAMATQLSYEEDSFGSSYDAGAEYPPVADTWDGTIDTTWYNDTDTEFVISTAEELAGFAAMVNSGDSFAGKTVKLNDDLDLQNLQWTPIGSSSNYFKGTFDGQNHTISNMSINVNTPDENQFVGLFGGIQNAVIKNLTMKDSDITALGKKVRAAAVVGIADSDKSTPQVLVLNFENITVDGCDINAEATSGSVLTGGVVGYSYPANMSNIIVSELTINGKAENNEVRAAAIAGYVCGQNISNNGNTRMAFDVHTFDVKDVTIEAEGYTVFAGGYAPYTYYGYIDLKEGNIDNLKIVVDAHEAFVGGLVGYFWRSDQGHTAENVHITNIDFDVTTDYLGETRVGGMVGTSQSPNTKYTNCSVSGKIVERCSDSANPVNYHAKVGGFVARTYEYAMQTYTNCVADVDIIASNIAGGFVGNHNSTVSYVNCEAKGDVTANIAGGFAGRLTEHGYTTAVTFEGCEASSNVTGTNVAGGFIGSTANHGWAAWAAGNGTAYGKTVTVKNCTVAGTVNCGNANYCAGVVGEAKMADGVKIVLDHVTCAITPVVTPDNSCVEVAGN